MRMNLNFKTKVAIYTLSSIVRISVYIYIFFNSLHLSVFYKYRISIVQKISLLSIIKRLSFNKINICLLN